MMLKFLTDIVLADLSFRDKEIAKAYFVEGYSQEEVSGMYQVSQSTVSRVIFSATKELGSDFSKWLFRSGLQEKHIKELFNDRNVTVQ